MKNLYKKTRAKLSFSFGFNPIIEKTKINFRDYIPAPYDGVVIVSADFELAWAWRFAKFGAETLKNALLRAKLERNNIPKIIQLSEQYNIPITWGTVGHLFLQRCNPINNIKHPYIERLPYFENEYWNFKEGDWFEHDPSSSSKDSPEWYAPDLINQIISSKINHEIACHTFSHISCSDNICKPSVLKSELEASQAAALKYGINLESFIFPGHTMGNYETLKEMGYSSMRTNFANTLGYPVLHETGIWEHKTTMEINHSEIFSISQNIERYRTIIDKCMKKHLVCNFWFHPSFNELAINTILNEVFNILETEKNKIFTTTFSDYSCWLNKQKNEVI